jgi:hypothetical protein
MRHFDTLVNKQLLKLLEALPQDGGPVVDQNPTAPDEPKRTTPQEKSNWEMTLLDVAKTAIYNVKNNPESLAIEDEEKLGIDVTPENKEEMLDLIYKIAGKPRAATIPIPEPEEQPAPETPPPGTQPPAGGAGGPPPGSPPSPVGKIAKASKPA